MRASVMNPPADYLDELAPLPEGIVWDARAAAQTDVLHLFVSTRQVLAEELAFWRTRLRPDAALWISWPKKSSRVPTDITEDVIRAECLPLGWVDVKVCAVNAVWSGLKLVVRKTLR